MRPVNNLQKCSAPVIPHGNAREDSAKRASTRENMAARAQLFYRYDTYQYTRRFYRYETVTRELFSSVYHQNWKTKKDRLYFLEDLVKNLTAASGFMLGLFRDKSEAEAFNLLIFWALQNALNLFLRTDVFLSKPGGIWQVSLDTSIKRYMLFFLQTVYCQPTSFQPAKLTALFVAQVLRNAYLRYLRRFLAQIFSIDSNHAPLLL